jgi:hypothetical protein
MPCSRAGASVLKASCRMLMGSVRLALFLVACEVNTFAQTLLGATSGSPGAVVLERAP